MPSPLPRGLSIQTDLLTQLQAPSEAQPTTLRLAARGRERNSAAAAPERLVEGAGDGESGA